MSNVVLRPLEAEQLPLVEPWFGEVETNRWLGGPQWPAQMLELASRPLGEFRGAQETGNYRWLAWDLGRAIGYIDCGTFDRWTTWNGDGNAPGVTDTIHVPSGSIAFVVDPVMRGSGYATAMLFGLVGLPELAEIDLFGAGVEPANRASIRSLKKAGFSPLDETPDFEGFVYFVWRRPGRG